MNESELTEAMIEIIISCQPLACPTSKIRRRLYQDFNRYYPNGAKVIRLLRQRSERDDNLIEIKSGRDIFWRYNDGGVLS